MDDAGTACTGATLLARVEMMIAELEREMPHLQLRHPGSFAIANAWAERYDAIVALTPPEARLGVESRLSRIGIRWGMMHGARVTQEFRALGGHLRGRGGVSGAGEPEG